MTAAIVVENVSKKYRLTRSGEERLPYRTLRDEVARWAQWPARYLSGRTAKTEDFWALKDVSFEVQPGEVVGIIGRNGAGKSTLLKVLSRITKPTSGRVRLRGRVGSLLEVGTGFHPELTGRENIYLSGAVLGMKRAEIRRKFDEIVAFAEVERFLDLPVKRYSSGMYMRLAFAVAAHLEPEILLVDEVLAVGDAAFQKKCLGKMGEVAKGGRTVIFVSHNMAAVEQLTSHAVLLDHGAVAYLGNAKTAIVKYQDRSLRSRRMRYEASEGRSSQDLEGQAEFRWVQLGIDESGLIGADQPIILNVCVVSHTYTQPLRISFTIRRYDGTPVGSAFTSTFAPQGLGIETVVRLELKEHRLAPGGYHFSMAVGKGNNEDGGMEDFDRLFDVLHFEVMSPGGAGETVAAWNTGWGAIRFPSPAVQVMNQSTS